MTPPATGRQDDELTALVHGLDLVDHHCHAVVGHDLDARSFELMIGEANRPAPAGCSTFDTSLGLAIRAWCAPLLDLPGGVDPSSYLERRLHLGAPEVNARMLSGGARQLLVDTGYRTDELTTLTELATWAGGTAYEIARLETMAETAAASLVGMGAAAGDRYAERFAEGVAEHSAAVGWKSIAAYRGQRKAGGGSGQHRRPAVPGPE